MRPSLSLQSIENIDSSDDDGNEEDEEEAQSSSSEEGDVDDISTDVAMTQNEASSIVKMSKSILGDKISNPRILKAVQIHNQNANDIQQLEKQMSDFRKFCYRIGKSHFLNNFILCLVIINSLLTVLKTNRILQTQYYITAFEQCCLAIYIFEAIIKIIGEKKEYFKDSWNKLDFLLIIISLTDYPLAYFSGRFLNYQSVVLSLQSLKTLKIFKVIKMFKSLYIFQSLLTLLDSVASSFVECVSSLGLLLIIMYFYAFVGFLLFKEISPNQFGDFSRAFFSMYQLCTLDDWFDVYNSVKEISTSSIIFFISFIIIGSFIIMNYITAVLTDNACQATVRYNENTNWMKKLIAKHNTLKKNEEKMMNKSYSEESLMEKYPELIHLKHNDISQILVILGEIERMQTVSNGHREILNELINQSLTLDS